MSKTEIDEAKLEAYTYVVTIIRNMAAKKMKQYRRQARNPKNTFKPNYHNHEIDILVFTREVLKELDLVGINIDCYDTKVCDSNLGDCDNCDQYLKPIGIARTAFECV